MRRATSTLLATFCLFALSGISGCKPEEPKYKEFTPEEAKPITEGHDHSHEGPHHGTVIELGEEEYHAEAVFDEEHEKITLYILDGALKEAVAIEQTEIVVTISDEEKTQFKLAASPLPTDPEGKSSRFESTDEELFDEFHEHEGLKGEFEVTIDGKTFMGAITHDHAHDHGHGKEGHKHEKEAKPADAGAKAEKKEESTEGAKTDDKTDAPAKNSDDK